jgi:hypothetical protein
MGQRISSADIIAPDGFPFVLPINGCGWPWHEFNIFHPFWGRDI